MPTLLIDISNIFHTCFCSPIPILIPILIPSLEIAGPVILFKDRTIAIANKPSEEAYVPGMDTSSDGFPYSLMRLESPLPHWQHLSETEVFLSADWVSRSNSSTYWQPPDVGFQGRGQRIYMVGVYACLNSISIAVKMTLVGSSVGSQVKGVKLREKLFLSKFEHWPKTGSKIGIRNPSLFFLIRVYLLVE